MKLSKREKVLIFILIVAVIGYAAYRFLPGSNLFNLDAMKEEYNQKSDAYDTMSQNLLLKSKYEENVKLFSDEINNLDVISDIQQENIIVFLDNYFTNNNIDANNISFTDATVVPMNDIVAHGEPKAVSTLETIMSEINGTGSVSEQNTADIGKEEGTDAEQAQKSEEEAEQKPSLTIRSISVNVAFESTYDSMIKFIDAIQINAVDISITNINTVSPGGNILQGTMTLNFYGVPKLDSFIEENQEWLWKDLVKFGKNNPFLIDGYATTFANAGNSFDFYMSVKPESSDLPTVIVGKAEDKSRSTYVYADSNKMEEVEFQFKKDNDKIYYKYKTKSSTYPSDGTWMEFAPVESDSIFIKIYSSARNSKTDSAGVNIAVTNTTGLKVRIEVEDDDTTNPRVYFKDARLVIVTRK
ncbi:MAG: hypothetical protein SA378_09725 [Sedimentibacter sp.]|uniref:hypothetical protein n=1 Tax=Sedimentibacter sp. TaxID=1960295 RepID=UPI0029828DC7|nr:hypothetical protein [Sedimentibacter sp.]MDW5300402.1 hypothetical protein [Sedimentibacter sp.]